MNLLIISNVEYKFMQNYTYLRPSSRMIGSKTTSLNNQTLTPRSNQGGKEIKYSLEEVESIARLREYLQKQNSDRQFSDDLLLRYCYLGNMSIIDQVQKFKYYEEWTAMPLTAKNIERGILHSGVFYCYGRDHEYCPNIYFHPGRITLKQFSISDYLICLRTLLSPVEQNMLIPGKIDKWNLIIDVRSFDESNLKSNFSIFLNNATKICNAYPFRLKRVFLVLPGSSASLWSKVVPFKNSFQQTQKFLNQLGLTKNLVKIANMKDFDKFIAYEEREKQYGGVLQNLTQFWPISSTNRLMEINSRFVEGSEESEQYQSVANDYSYFGQKVEVETRCNFKQFCSIQ